MVKSCRIIFLVIMIIPFVLLAQDTKPNTSALSFEVLNEALKMSKEPQSIKILLNCDGSQDLELVIIKMPQMQAIWSVVSAKFNDQLLWLIKSQSSSNNSNVLAWDLDKQNSELILYPNEWSTPYVLELDIQLNMKDIQDSQKDTDETINMEAVIAGVSYHCSPSGRGNQLRMQGKR